MKLAAFTLTTALLLSAGAAAAQAAPTEPEEPPRYPPSSVRPKLIAGGLAVTGLAYGAGFLAASTWPEVPGANELKIPVVGPWLAIAKNDCSPDDPGCGFSKHFRGILTAIGGLMQLGGLAIVGEAIFMTTESSFRPSAERSKVTVRPVPMVTSRVAGLGIVGAF